ncbi:MAG: hypothetical protein P4L57_02850 [Rhizomicrobium sp.]|nr:hypothetical protein [Rhizomicrobium sp.]
MAAISLILLGDALEILQGFTGRDPDIFDALATALDVIAGSVGYAIIGLLSPKPPAAEPH